MGSVLCKGIIYIQIYILIYIIYTYTVHISKVYCFRGGGFITYF